ncbi:MAG TPA: maleylpyruvate isomerase N-terminal domain-containing protein [Actinomycetota bacterium]|nr:maleylpyruvate isomerase N-terminal domain-containing protein [Actinomycetota bacterium]
MRRTNMDKETLSAREAEAWAAFRDAVGEIDPDRRETPGVNVEGWTVKDVLWHVAHWWNDLVGTLDAMRGGTYVEPPDDDAATNAENSRVLGESRRMTLADVERGLSEARARVLAAWAALPEVDAAAEREFVWETIDHYEEHLPDLRGFAAGTA